jgi:RNA recognition motif-containing protein
MLAGAGCNETGIPGSCVHFEYVAPFFQIWRTGAIDTSSFFQEFFFMSKNIYVGNLPWSATEDEVRSAFAAYGDVTSVKLIEDRETGRPRGFGFVEMDDAGAAEAIENLDGKDFGGRNIKVNEAKPRVERPRW